MPLGDMLIFGLDVNELNEIDGVEWKGWIGGWV